MAKKYKEYEEDIFGGVTPGVNAPRDVEFTGTTEGGIPETESMRIIREGRKFQKKWIADPAAAPFQVLGNILTPKVKGKNLFGKENYWLNKFGLGLTETQVAERDADLENKRLYRMKRDKVQDNITILLQEAVNKYQETGDGKYLDQGEEMRKEMMFASGLEEKDFIDVGPQVYSNYDVSGTWTSTPDPYPVIGQGSLMAGSIGGSIKGWKWGQKQWAKRFAAGAARGAKTVKGPWWARAGGAVLGGMAGVGLMDYGYEVALDMMSNAGKAKNWLAKSPNQQLNLISKAIPESLTFGPQGINRPDQITRLKNASKEMAIDGAIGTAFFGARPAYYGLRKLVGSGVFRMFKQPAGKGVPGGKEILEAEQRLYKATGLAAPKGEKATFNLPGDFLENINIKGIGLTQGLPDFFTKLTKSKAFNWLGPDEYYSSKWWPDLDMVAGTNVRRHEIGSPILAGLMKVFGRAPYLGTLAYRNIARKMDDVMDVGENIIGRLAPYQSAKEMGVNFKSLSRKSLHGFRTAAKEKEAALVKAADEYGAVVYDKTLVDTAKKIVQFYDDTLQMGMKDTAGRYGREEAEAMLIPSKVPAPLIDFLRTQVLNTSTGARSIKQMYGLRAQMDALRETLEKGAYGNIADDMSNIVRAWETDIGNLSKSGVPEVHRLWKDYEDFVSNGMLIWGTDVGQAVGKVQRYGFNLKIGNDPVRASHSLWKTIIDVAEKDPSLVDLNIKALRNIVGDKAYNKGLGVYIADTFNNSIVQKEGAEIFDASVFRKALGLGSEKKMSSFFKDALPGPTITKTKYIDEFGIEKEFVDDIFGKTLKDAGIEAGEGLTKTEITRLPTHAMLEDFATIMESAAKHGIPEISTFMQRRAVMAGVRTSITSALPTQALGLKTKTVGAGVAGAMFPGWVKTAALAWGARYMAGVLTSPVSMRVYMNTIDDTLPAALRVLNFQKLVRMFPEEWMDFDKELAELEESQRYLDTTEKVMQRPNELKQQGSRWKDLAIEGGKNVLEGLDKIEPTAPEMIQKMMQKPDSIYPDADYAPEIGGEGAGYDQTSMAPANQAGSSLMSSRVMNPAAAQALYGGDLDAALAYNAGQPQYAAGGGLMEMNPVMGNDGKFTEMQTGINDNPFTKGAKGGGILSIL